MLVFVQTLCGSAQILLFFTVLNLIKKKKRRTHTSDWTFHWHGLKRGKTQGSAQHRVLTPLRVFYTTANAVGSNCPGNLGGPEFSRVVYSSCLSHLEKKKHRLWIKKKKKKNYSWCHQWNLRCSMLAVLPWADTVAAMAMTSRSVRQTVLLMVSLEQWMNVHDWYYTFYVSPLQAHQSASSTLHPQLHAQPTNSFLSLRRARRVLAPSLTHKRWSEGVTAFSTTDTRSSFN